MYLSMSFSLRCNSLSHHASSRGRSESSGSSAIQWKCARNCAGGKYFASAVHGRCMALKHLDHDGRLVVELRRLLGEFPHGAIERIEYLARGLFAVLPDDAQGALDAEERFIRPAGLLDAVGEEQDQFAGLQGHRR